MKIEELIPGQVYVTQGGTLTLKGEKDPEVIPWGYDRVRFIKVVGNHIIVETAWNSECELPLDYALEPTIEEHVRSEFPLRGIHVDRTVIPFEEALAKGICKEITGKVEQKVQDDTVPVSTQSLKIKKSRTIGIVRNDLYDKIIEFFSEFHSIAEAVTSFDIIYQKVRHTLENINKRGHAGQRFNLEKDDSGKAIKFKLTKA